MIERQKKLFWGQGLFLTALQKKLLRLSNSLVSSLIILYFYKREMCSLCQKLYGFVKFIIVIWYKGL